MLNLEQIIGTNYRIPFLSAGLWEILGLQFYNTLYPRCILLHIPQIYISYPSGFVSAVKIVPQIIPKYPKLGWSTNSTIAFNIIDALNFIHFQRLDIII